MKNINNWKPTKYVWDKDKLVASGNSQYVNIGSRVMVDAIARYYGKYLPDYAMGKLLDLGCGHVPLFDVYRNHVSDIVCVDWDNTRHKNQFLDLTHDLTEKLPFEDKEFDTIILSDVLEHIPNPNELCDEIARVLAPGGVLIMNVPFLYWLHETPHDYYRYTEYSLRRFMREMGLETQLLEPIGGVAEVLTDIISKLFASTGTPGKVISKTMHSGFKLFGRTKVAKRISDKTKSIFPLGYFLIAKKTN